MHVTNNEKRGHKYERGQGRVYEVGWGKEGGEIDDVIIL